MDKSKGMPDLTHLDDKERVRMVDVSDKSPTVREATARGAISMRPATLDLISENRTRKANVIETARIAGIMAAKKTSGLIPMCHPLCITHARVDFLLDASSSQVSITATVSVTGPTGVEMEALTAVCVAALTIYDMCKSHDREMTISEIRLTRKSGGRSGAWSRGISGLRE